MHGWRSFCWSSGRSEKQLSIATLKDDLQITLTVNIQEKKNRWFTLIARINDLLKVRDFLKPTWCQFNSWTKAIFSLVCTPSVPCTLLIHFYTTHIFIHITDTPLLPPLLQTGTMAAPLRSCGDDQREHQKASRLQLWVIGNCLFGWQRSETDLNLTTQDKTLTQEMMRGTK